VTIHKAALEDRDRVYSWANDPDTRAMSFNTQTIAYADHIQWFTRMLANDPPTIFVAKFNKEACAFVRLDPDEEKGSAQIGINLAPGKRGLGLGKQVLEAASDLAAALGYQFIVALIRPDNLASIRSFERAGYRRDGQRLVQGIEAFRYLHSLV
jgi:RimJ/RimL family protein N-acetyltransferase